MAQLPPLYKYLDVQGATLSLRDRTFKHSKPSYFNDTEDLTIKSIFPETDEEAVKILNAGLSDIILRNVNKDSDYRKSYPSREYFENAGSIPRKSERCGNC